MSLSKLTKKFYSNYPTASFTLLFRNFHNSSNEKTSNNEKYKTKRFLLIASAISSVLIGSSLYAYKKFEKDNFYSDLKKKLFENYFITYAKEASVDPSSEVNTF